MPSARFLANLSGYATPRWTTAVDWSNDGGATWTAATYVTGTVTCSALSQVRWASSITLRDIPFGLNGVNPYQTRYRIRHGMVYSDHEQPEYVGMGVYRLKTITRSSQDTASFDITGESFESYLIQARLVKPRTYAASSAKAVIQSLIRGPLPNAVIDWLPGVDPATPTPKLVAVADRWGTIDGGRDATSVAKALGGRVYTNGYGTWQVAPTPSLQDDIAWEAFEGPGGVSLGVAETLSNEGVTNVEIVVGSPTGSDTVVGPGVAMDLDPSSLTYVGRSPDAGGYGYVPGDEYQTQMVTTLSQATKVARSRLASRLGLRQTLAFATLHDPTKLPGQVGLIYGLDFPKRCILDSVTYDLSASPGPLQCQTRTTQTRLAGDITDASDGGSE